MSEQAELQMPVQIVMEADVERNMLLDEAAELEGASKGSLTSEQEARLVAVHERMVVIGAESAEGRANALLANLGFSDELYGTPADIVLDHHDGALRGWCVVV